MSLFRRLPTSRLIALCAAVLVVAVGATTIALAAGSGGSVPLPKRLSTAIHDVLTARPVQGLSARITFTNKLIDSSSVRGGGPLLSGATGRLWVGGDGQLRLELQSERGDAQIVSDGRSITLYDATSNTAYQAQLPADRGGHAGRAREARAPGIPAIKHALAGLMRHADVVGPTPSNVGGQPAYTVQISPKHDGGLIGALAVAWDAARGVPLRAAVYAQGSTTPVLELAATDVQYGPIGASTFDVRPPHGAKVVQVRTPAGTERKAGAHHHGRAVTGLAAVQGRLAFKLSAPDKLVGLPRREVKLLDGGRKAGALVMYGQGLGGMLVLEQGSQPGDLPSSNDHSHDGQRVSLPTISVNGATGVELSTPLGTGLRFVRGGVTYTVLGSVPAAAAEAAARGL